MSADPRRADDIGNQYQPYSVSGGLTDSSSDEEDAGPMMIGRLGDFGGRVYYQSCFYKNHEFVKDDAVVLAAEDMDYIATIVDIFEEEDKKMATFRWFFQNSDLEQEKTPKQEGLMVNQHQLYWSFEKEPNEIASIMRPCTVVYYEGGANIPSIYKGGMYYCGHIKDKSTILPISKATLDKFSEGSEKRKELRDLLKLIHISRKGLNRPTKFAKREFARRSVASLSLENPFTKTPESGKRKSPTLPTQKISPPPKRQKENTNGREEKYHSEASFFRREKKRDRHYSPEYTVGGRSESSSSSSSRSPSPRRSHRSPSPEFQARKNYRHSSSSRRDKRRRKSREARSRSTSQRRSRHRSHDDGERYPEYHERHGAPNRSPPEYHGRRGSRGAHRSHDRSIPEYTDHRSPHHDYGRHEPPDSPQSYGRGRYDDPIERHGRDYGSLYSDYPQYSDNHGRHGAREHLVSPQRYGRGRYANPIASPLEHRGRFDSCSPEYRGRGAHGSRDRGIPEYTDHRSPRRDYGRHERSYSPQGRGLDMPGMPPGVTPEIFAYFMKNGMAPNTQEKEKEISLAEKMKNVCEMCGEKGHQRNRCNKCSECLQPGHRRSECTNPPTLPEEGARHIGLVKNVREGLGGFIQIPGYGKQGLLHISRISPGTFVSCAEDYLKQGQWVEVIVTAHEGNGKYSVEPVEPLEKLPESERNSSGGSAWGGGNKGSSWDSNSGRSNSNMESSGGDDWGTDGGGDSWANAGNTSGGNSGGWGDEPQKENKSENSWGDEPQENTDGGNDDGQW